MKGEYEKLLNNKDKYIPVDCHKQVHKVGNKVWYVSSLLKEAEFLPVETRNIEDIRAVKLNLPLLKDHGVTHLELAYHMKVALEADMNFPIILAKDGRIMDGHHRVIKALALGIPQVKVVQFTEDPVPDKYVDENTAYESLQDYFYRDMYVEIV